MRRMTMLTDEKIPNNVDLAGDKRLQRALEQWQPNYLDWWQRDGPRRASRRDDVYLRTAISRRDATAGRTSTT